MQYLLSKEEYEALQSKPDASMVEVQKRALHAARVTILEMAGADCVHAGLGYGSRKTCGYCSGCPIVKIADGMGIGLAGRHDYLNALCDLPKEWSK